MGKSWKNAGKVENAQKKGQVFSRFAREIQVATRAGGPDPAINSRLRLAIDAAKSHSCPNDTIERAVKKGSGKADDGKVIEEIVYEGYAPHGVGVIVECQTDNKHRTAPEIRHAFKQYDGNLGAEGSVAWMFARIGLLEGKKEGKFDPDEEAIEAGANEVYADGDNYEFYTNAEDLDSVGKALRARGWHLTKSELSYVANTPADLSPEQRKDVEDFLTALDDLDDTHRVHATL